MKNLQSRPPFEIPEKLSSLWNNCWEVKCDWRLHIICVFTSALFHRRLRFYDTANPRTSGFIENADRIFYLLYADLLSVAPHQSFSAHTVSCTCMVFDAQETGTCFFSGIFFFFHHLFLYSLKTQKYKKSDWSVGRNSFIFTNRFFFFTQKVQQWWNLSQNVS